MVMVKMEWERDESWFISVAPTERFFLPTCQQQQQHQGPLVRETASPQ
jgi:hypothetical protein